MLLPIGLPWISSRRSLRVGDRSLFAFVSSTSHDGAYGEMIGGYWDKPEMQAIVTGAIKWGLRLVDADVTPRPVPDRYPLSLIPFAFSLVFFRVRDSSRISHAFANFQSRITVSGETFSTSAVSSTLRPPKNRSSTTWTLRS